MVKMILSFNLQSEPVVIGIVKETATLKSIAEPLLLATAVAFGNCVSLKQTL